MRILELLAAAVPLDLPPVGPLEGREDLVIPIVLGSAILVAVIVTLVIIVIRRRGH